MDNLRRFYIGGQWVNPVRSTPFTVINPATEEPVDTISLGSGADVDESVAAALEAFASWQFSTVDERLQLFQRLLAIYHRRFEEMAAAICREMGAPMAYARSAQAESGRGHLQAAIDTLHEYPFTENIGPTRIVREPVGVCGLITPWNWPINQIMLKVAPALATGCTVVLKPSELAPLSATLFADMLDEANCPAGVFNLVHGTGIEVGQALSSHPDVSMVSFTGSVAAGVSVAHNAAPTVKRVVQELGGKSANILLPHDDFDNAVRYGVQECFDNAGQSCDAPTRMLVPRSHLERSKKVAYETAVLLSAPDALAPVVSAEHYDRVQQLIASGVDEGASLLIGGPGKAEGKGRGYYVRPTIFADVHNDMRIAREEIFATVLVIIAWDTVTEAIAIANDSPYGLAAYVAGQHEEARKVAAKLRAGTININYHRQGYDCPFGGYGHSGNGREGGRYGFDDYVEIKTITG